MIVKEWFLRKALPQDKLYGFHIGESFVKKETDKAVLIGVNSEFGSFDFWCPKSALEQEEEIVNPTIIEINGKHYVKEILIKNESMLNKLGLTIEQVEKL